MYLLNKILLFAAVIIIISTALLLNSIKSYSEADSWEAMVKGIEKYSIDTKLKEKFIKLCQENETALINGRVDTGSGLYIAMDVPIYDKPNRIKISELKDGTTVVLTGLTQRIGESDWVQIKFLQISSLTETAVDISEAWVERSYLKQLPK